MAWSRIISSVLLLSCAVTCFGQQDTCPFFSVTRTPKPQSNLPNCSWYEYSSCCERAEISAVFQDMLSIEGASQDCRNRLNYMMCYMCDPRQRSFIVGGAPRQARICQKFCDEVVEMCGNGRVNGVTFSSQVSTGRQFCENNFFIYSAGTTNCLSFNASAFSSAPSSLVPRQSSVLLMAVPAMLVFLLQAFF